MFSPNKHPTHRPRDGRKQASLKNSMFVCMIAAFLAGCSTGPSPLPARTFAKKERIDVSESDVMVLSTRVSVMPDTTTSVATVTSANVAPVSTADVVWKHADSLIWIHRICEIDDNPFGVALFITGHANSLINQMQESLDDGQLPSGWIVDAPLSLIGLAESKIVQIKDEPEADYLRQLAWDYRTRTYHRSWAMLKEIAKRRSTR